MLDENRRIPWLAVTLLLLAALACEAPTRQAQTPLPSSGDAPGEGGQTDATEPPGLSEGPAPDVEGPGGCTLNAGYVADITIPDDTVLAPGTAFNKVWRVRNSGTCTWEVGTQLVYASGDPMAGPAAVDVPSVAPDATTDVGADFVAPASPGTYRATYQMQSPEGTRYGSQIYVQIVVPEPPTEEPTEEPTDEPTEEPTEEPTDEPTEEPTEAPSGPDLHIKKLTLDPANPKSGDSVHVTLQSHNKGNQSTGPYVVSFQYGERRSQVCTWEVVDNDAGEGKTLQCDIVVYERYTAVAKTDSVDDVDETNETNNREEIEIPIAKANGVDLYVCNMTTSPSNPARGATLQAKISVCNRGTSSAGAFSMSWIYGVDSDHDKCTWKVTGLGAGKSKTVSCDASLLKSWNTVAKADVKSEINESVETNNQHTLRVEVHD